ncbi:MAG: ATP-binding cassette domain-containing protein, partial [Herbaspirillum sp.]
MNEQTNPVVTNQATLAGREILRIVDLAVSYGQIEAVKGINLSLNEGEITALVGANGAGKSTALLAISGLLKPVRGQVLLNGEDL